MNNKNFFAILLFVFAFSISSFGQKNTIQGNLQLKHPVESISIGYTVGTEHRREQTKLVNGKFSFSREINEPTWGMLVINYVSSDTGKRSPIERIQLFIEPGTITVNAKDSLKYAEVSGSKSHKVFEDYEKLRKPYDKKRRDLNNLLKKLRSEKDEAGIEKTRKELADLAKEMEQKLLVDYLNENPKTPIALYVMFLYFGVNLDLEKAEPIFKKLDPTILSAENGVAFKNRMNAIKNTEVGAMAMDFTQNDTLGNPVSLSSFKGKYVLLDFWASWCVPCRAENPNVVKAFHEYKDKNFTIIGVSLDQPGKKQAWLDAIKKDNLTWTHVSDLNFWNNAVAKQYGIKSVPMNFLIDPKGKIIAKNIRGEELNTTLAEGIK